MTMFPPWFRHRWRSFSSVVRYYQWAASAPAKLKGRSTFQFDRFDRQDIANFKAAIDSIEFTSDRLRVAVYRNATVTELQPMPSGQMRGGAFDENGRLIPEAGCVRHTEGNVLGSAIPSSGDPPERLQSAIYGGALFSGYGHIFLESCARLWAAARFPSVPILFQADPKNTAGLKTLTGIARLLGVDEDRIRLVTMNVVVSQLFVPEAGLSLGLSMNLRYVAFLRSRLRRLHKWRRKPTKLYLSRSALNWRQRRAIGEKELEGALRERGYRVVHPEQLPIEDQITEINTARCLAGFIGSQMHNLFFKSSRRPVDVLYLCSSKPNINFFQIDLLSPGRKIYSNIARYDPAFDFGNRSPFHFEVEHVQEMLDQVGMPVGTIGTGDTSNFIFEWARSYFYAKVFRTKAIAGKLDEDIDLSSRPELNRLAKKLGPEAARQVHRAFADCARMFRVQGQPHIDRARAQLVTMFGQDAGPADENSPATDAKPETNSGH